MKRYALLVKRFLGVRSFSRKHPSKQLHKSKIMSLAVAAMSVLTLGVGVTAAYAAVTTTKTGTDTTTNSTAQTQPGHSVRWVMSYTHSGSIGTLELNDAIPGGTQYVPGSLVTPPSFDKSYSQNNGTSYGSVDPGTATTNIRAEGVAPATQTAVTSGLAAPPSSFNGAQGGGDGYEAFFWKDPDSGEERLYNFNHHIGGNLIQCHTITGANCTSTVTYPAHAPSADGSAFTNTGAADVSLGMMPQGVEDMDTGKVYLPASVGSNSGIMCFDLANEQSCGFTQIEASIDSSGFTKLTGGALVNKGTSSAPDKRFYLTDLQDRVYCFSITNNALCTVTPNPIQADPTITTDTLAGGLGPTNVTESWGNRYVFNYYTKTVTNPDTTTTTTAQIGCIDTGTTVTAAPTRCTGYPVTVAGARPYLVPHMTNTGTIDGVCTAKGDNTIVCLSLTGTSITSPYPAAPASFNLGHPQGFGSTVVSGTKVYLAYEETADGNGNGVSNQATYTCFDFAINAPCAGYNPFVSAERILPYTLRQDPYNPACIWETGDLGIFQVFDAETGALGCSRSSASVEAQPSAFYCDGLPGHVRNWTTVNLNNITGSQYSSAKLTLLDANGNPVAGFNEHLLSATEQSSGVINISSIPVTGNTATLTAQITLYAPDGTPWQGDAKPYLQLTWDGDPIQFCFETTVTECSQLTSITNTANFLTVDDSAPTGQTDTSTATLQSPDSTCTAEVHTKKTVDKTTYNPGDTLTYTIEVTNGGSIAADNVSVTDDLTQILDDATYNGDATITSGTGSVGYTAPTLSYTNPNLAAGATSIITFTVTTTNGSTGNKSLPNKVVSNSGNCVQGSTDPDCSTLTQGPDVVVVKTADKATFNPGDTINYTLTITNNGAGPANANVTDDLTNLLDDATYNNNAAVTSGTGSVSYTAPIITYTNPSLGAGQSATVTFSVTTQSPGTGDKSMPNRAISNIG